MRISRTQWTAVPMALVLTACGGGGGGDSGGGTPTPVVPAWGDRIEPYDPGKAGGVAKAAPQPAVALADPAETPAITLGPLAAPLAGAAAAPGTPRQIGQPRDVPATAGVADTAALLRWRPGPGGTQVAALRFESQGAHGVRLGVLVQALPPGAVLRFYGAARDAATEVGAQELQAVAERNAQGGAGDVVARTYWSPDFAGPQTTLEVQIPATARPADVQLAVPRLSHFTVSPAEDEGAFVAKVGKSGSCAIDVSCSPDYLEQSRAVARMTFTAEDGNSYWCTGTLLNDAASSGTPYFLGANHCIPSQAVASTLATEWFYRSASCGSTVPNPGAQNLTGGATLLYASAATDTSFMRLNSPAPAGIVYAGSYYGGVPVGQQLASVQHPDGEPQTLSVGTLLRYGNCSGGSCISADPGRAGFMVLDWQQGSTAPGSSGAAAFVTIGAQRYVAGQLYGGTASCTNTTGVDYFGRFDRSYQAALRKWLNP